MGVLIGQARAWRNYVGVFAALLAALVTFLAIGKPIKVHDEEPRIRLVDADTTAQTRAVRTEMARIASLWREGRGYECVAPASYGETETARFAAVMTHGVEGALTPAVVPDSPVGALWSRLASNYDGAALVQRTVSIEAGGPARVTVTRAARFSAAA